MAKYEDYAKKYVKKQGGIDAEIEQAAEAQEERATATPTGFKEPERFKGKSREDIIAQYEELQKFNSQQANDLGAMRALVDSLATQTPAEASPSEEEVKEISYDDLLDNPADAVRKTVDAHPAVKRLEQLEAELAAARLEEAKAAFAQKHADYEEIGADPAFRNWVVSDATRAHLYQQANSYDFGAADALLSLYKAEQGIQSLQGEVQRQTAMTDGMLETSDGMAPTAPPTFSRQKWLKTMTRAKQGDLDAQDYIHRNSAAYRKALASGNVRD